MQDLKVEFGKRVAYLRNRKGLTQEQLADLIGKSHSTIAKIEQGVHAPRFVVFEKIVEILDAHPHEFYEFEWKGKGY